MVADGIQKFVLVACLGRAAALLSRWLTGRIAGLARLTTLPRSADELPGPFVVHGDDEIATIAQAMNGLRNRVAEQLKAFNLQDIRRRA